MQSYETVRPFQASHPQRCRLLPKVWSKKSNFLAMQHGDSQRNLQKVGLNIHIRSIGFNRIYRAPACILQYWYHNTNNIYLSNPLPNSQVDDCPRCFTSRHVCGNDSVNEKLGGNSKAQAEKHQTSTSKFSPKLQKWSKKRKKLWKFHDASKLLGVFFTLRLFQFPSSCGPKATKAVDPSPRP